MKKNNDLSYYIKKRKYQSINRPLFHVPQSLCSRTFTCEICSTEFSPDWLEKRPPITPIEMNSGDWLMPISSETSCPNCKGNVSISLPQGKFREPYLFFADEAYRNFGNQYLVNYSLVGVQKKHFNDLVDIMKSWKDHISIINGGGQVQVAHLTDLWSQKVRKRTTGMEKLDKGDVIFLYKMLAKQIANNKNIRLYSSSVLINKDDRNFKKQLQMFKEVVTSSLLSISMQETTQSGYSPEYIFEDDGKMGWLIETFERMRLTLMFPFICNNTPVPEPKLINKSSDEKLLAGIELADSLCFASARSAHNQYQNQPFDLDMSLLGNVAYISFNQSGDGFLQRQVGYPGIHS